MGPEITHQSQLLSLGLSSLRTGLQRWWEYGVSLPTEGEGPGRGGGSEGPSDEGLDVGDLWLSPDWVTNPR